tara:strand:+ start:2528 stop:2773 length:246 start_codon:yes stop_codon:yes gene_type:complete
MGTLREAVEGVRENEFVRVVTKSDRNGKESVHTIKPDYHYWPTVEYTIDPVTHVWTSRELRMTLEANLVEKRIENACDDMH